MKYKLTTCFSTSLTTLKVATEAHRQVYHLLVFLVWEVLGKSSLTQQFAKIMLLVSSLILLIQYLIPPEAPENTQETSSRSPVFLPGESKETSLEDNCARDWLEGRMTGMTPGESKGKPVTFKIQFLLFSDVILLKNMIYVKSLEKACYF